MWGPGSPPFEGRAVRVAEALCYPRPVQERIPILVGGGGERTTLRLVARYADACNLFGDAATVRHKVDVLRRHCADVGRDPSEVAVTQLSSALVTNDPAAPVHGNTVAGTVEDHVGRYRELAEAGVRTAIVRLAPLDEAAIARFAPVIAAFA
jgi:alkanesulfonate monooxygenase SsuD/methylene tetrahydromethanopterin reductase-like flavin-dependent oxidoreductase (luciferase family)